jgi:hypothetical protein
MALEFNEIRMSIKCRSWNDFDGFMYADMSGITRNQVYTSPQSSLDLLALPSPKRLYE